MSSYDRVRLINNIQRMAKEKDVKIGDMEEKAGVSTGLISRLKKDDTKGNFTVDLLSSVAKQLECTLDYLVYSGEEELSENEKLMLKFIDKLVRDTDQYTLEWTMMAPMIMDRTFLFQHPLFRAVDDSGEDPDGNFHYFKSMVYDSRFLENGSASINGNCFHVLLDDFTRTSLYVMNVTHSIPGKFFDKEDIIEMYFIDNGGNVKPLACSKLVCKDVSGKMQDLYDSIVNARSHLTVDSRARSIIDSYLKK